MNRLTILWVSNTVFPDLASELGLDIPVVGGWMYGLAKKLASSEIDLHVATISQTSNFEKKIGKITYHLLKSKKSITIYDTYLEEKWKKLVFEIKPDLIHIHGTEYAHGLSLLNACPDQRFVVSIQGLISVYANYFLGGISFKNIIKNITVRDILRNDNLYQAQKKFQKRGQWESHYIRQSNNAIGRTQWDKDHVVSMHPSGQYHFCNEILRDRFYDVKKWDLKSKTNHLIFLSQAAYPIKGLHKVLQAISLLKNDFSNIRVRIGGSNILRGSSFSDKLKRGGYASYIYNLINDYRLHGMIEFVGNLNEEEIICEYQNCHVFVCPSSIENSPNSLGEAQLLGVPCIASYVGGVPDMVTHGYDGLLYRFEEEKMLAQRIKSVFLDDSLAQKLSNNGIVTARKRHDIYSNLQTTLSIYQKIIFESKQ